MLKIMRSNALGPLALTALLLPLLAPGGTIVFINSSQGLSARKGAGAYAASKHALRAIADALRADLDGRGIRVTSIYPGRTATPMQQGLYASRNEPYHPELLLQPETIADLVLGVVSLPPAAEVTDAQPSAVAQVILNGGSRRCAKVLRRGSRSGHDRGVQMNQGMGRDFPCRSCGLPDTELVLDLGLVPASDTFPLVTVPGPDAAYPLELFRCNACTLLQLGPVAVLAPETPTAVDSRTAIEHAEAGGGIDRR